MFFSHGDFFFAISCICFQLPVLMFHFLLLRPYLPSPSCLFHLFYIFYFCLSTLLPPPSQVVQDLLPLIFQLRRSFLRCPNCSSLCFQHEMTRRSWGLLQTASRSGEVAVKSPSFCHFFKLNISKLKLSYTRLMWSILIMFVSLQNVPRILTSGGEDSRIKVETVRQCPCCMYIIGLAYVLRCVFFSFVQSSCI